MCTQILLFGQRRITERKANTTSAGIVFDYAMLSKGIGRYWTAMLDSSAQTVFLNLYSTDKLKPLKTYQYRPSMGIVPLRLYYLAAEWKNNVIDVYLDGYHVLSAPRSSNENAGAFGAAIGQGHAHFNALTGYLC